MTHFTTLLSEPRAKGLFRGVVGRCVMSARLASTICDLRIRDILGTGTVNESMEGSYGNLLDIMQVGKVPLALLDASPRRFVQNGDLPNEASKSGSVDRCISVMKETFQVPVLQYHEAGVDYRFIY